MKRVCSLLVAAVLLFVVVGSVTRAGGWAVVRLDAMPQAVVVGEPVKIGMMILQHGKTPWVYDNVRVRGIHATGETFTTRAEMDAKGHYTATLNFSRAGKWEWAVASGLAPEWQAMPELEVANSAQDEALRAEAVSAKHATPIWETTTAKLLPALGVVGLVGSVSGMIFWLRARKLQ